MEQLARLNLLVGGNNSGKTSVLEALAVFSAPLDIAEWSSIARTREVRQFPGLMRGSLTSVEAIRWLFPNHQADAGAAEVSTDVRFVLALRGIGGWRVRRLFAECTAIRGFPPVDTLRPNRDRDLEHSASEDEGWRISAWIDSDPIATAGSEQGVEVELWPSAGFSRPVRRSQVRAPFVMLAPYSHRNQPLQLRRFSRLIEEGSRSDLLMMLRAFDPQFEDLEIITDRSSGSPAISVRRAGSVVPASVMGDGFRRALTIALAITEARSGLLLIDEIETALHVSVLSNLFGWLIHACEIFNVQLFATTHSLEAVTGMLAAVPEHSHELLAAYHFGSDAGKSVPPKRYSIEMMKRLVQDRGLDIR